VGVRLTPSLIARKVDELAFSVKLLTKEVRGQEAFSLENRTTLESLDLL